MKTLSKNDKVQTGDFVYIYYDDLQGITGIVSHIHDRNEGHISVRIDTEIYPKIDTSTYMLLDRYIPLVLQAHEWELSPRVPD